MSNAARIHDVESLQRFRVALATFGEEAQAALATTEIEVRRMLDWVRSDRVTYWQGRIRQLTRDLGDARTQRHRKRISAHDPRMAKDSVEREAARNALRQLREAEERLQRTRRWIPVVQHAVDQYRGLARGLADQLENDLEASIGRIDTMLQALKAYLSTFPPSGAGPVEPDSHAQRASTTSTSKDQT